MDQLTWEALRLRIGVPEANKELDRRTESIFKMLKQLSTVLMTTPCMQDCVSRETFGSQREINTKEQFFIWLHMRGTPVL